jgi:hypothetical protein
MTRYVQAYLTGGPHGGRWHKFPLPLSVEVRFPLRNKPEPLIKGCPPMVLYPGCGPRDLDDVYRCTNYEDWRKGLTEFPVFQYQEPRRKEP